MGKTFKILFWLAVAGTVIAIFVSHHEPTQYRHPAHQKPQPADAAPVGHPFRGNP